MTDEEIALRTFLVDVMHPNVNEANRNANDRRAVFNACASIEAAAAALYWVLFEKGTVSKNLTEGKFKGRLSDANKYFRIVHDVAEAQKHGKLTRASSTSRTVTAASDLHSAPQGFDFSQWDEFMFDTAEAISVTFDGIVRNIAANAVHAASFLEGEVFLAEAGKSSVSLA